MALTRGLSVGALFTGLCVVWSNATCRLRCVWEKQYSLFILVFFYLFYDNQMYFLSFLTEACRFPLIGESKESIRCIHSRRISAPQKDSLQPVI